MDNSIAKSFSFLSLIKFTIPSVVMLVFMSLYTIIDGIFVSRFVNTDALSSVNIVYPFINVVIAVGVMLATGSSAVIAKKIGEGKTEEAKKNFTLIILLGATLGILISFIGYTFLEKIIYTLGGNNRLYGYCRDYLTATLIFVPAFIINLLFQYLTITAGKPNIGLLFTLIGGFSNIILDYLFIVPMDMGISGAAYATGMGNLIPAILGIIYFSRKKASLYFVKPSLDINVILTTITNGSSEMVTNLSAGVTTMLFNIVMMKLLGSDGVAAITIVLYGEFLITSAYIGFSSGVAPIISYNYGNKNEHELKKIIKYSIIFILLSSVILFTVAILASPIIVGLFSESKSNVFNIAYNGFRLFAIGFLIMGTNIFTSAMFTAFSNGKISATISFLRTFVFIVCGITFLPKYLNVNGVWLAVPLAELLTVIISILFINKYKNIYGYCSKNKKYNKKEKELEDIKEI
ncbi:MATE family efflux transporter [Romboutsia hominis]|uniref:Multidrug export protein MepA n=1 Tax=Romboutsia hominis TaxID=1507512 RepID=A0A2P2BTJ4_9FIRM|nr:MATE family efflux transporter [Romboutsia hominis]CEI72294.1 MOP/MATE multidrug-resistance efflux pump [Romboutsia hominis]